MNTVYGKSIASIEVRDGDKFGENGGFTAILSTPSLDRDGDRLHRDEWVEPLLDRYPLDIDHGMSVADTVGSFHPYFEGDNMMMDAYFASTPKAQEVRTLINEGHIQGVSVAFLTDKSKKDSEPCRELLNAGIVATPSNRDAMILASKAAGALKDALSDTVEGDVPEEIKSAVLEALRGDTKDSGVFIDVHTKLNPDSVKAVVAEVDGLIADMSDRVFKAIKAAATASGVGGDGALVQAIHDASSHLGAACPVIEVSDDGTGASSGANKSVATDEHDETLIEVSQPGEESTEGLEAFEKALDQVLTAEDSPALEEPAPADEAAAASTDAAEDEALELQARSLSLRLSMLASQ